MVVNKFLIILLGIGVQKDLNNARKYYEIASESNNPAGCYYLAEFYFKGIGNLE